ncbi:methyltransferase domain-containing protein [Lentiprolixibacter aurantiacus]|uniref:Methyltransferase domain-containing protein n=1 Tax=Lentiprolixibacter aurantiacus TaxID=2993939 RepID=A0AAE3MME6_9FLAO|nr:methyltransferase domain-containing protein [Lentiprolixibacter aurantiacus]MCX2720088.1 methyltransferase domain-containing protein [Lentiprolixibacter aurantiacus]
MKLDKNYWEERYLENKLGWDIGYVSTPIKTYVDQLDDTSLKILIPGAGRGYEARYLHENGFKETYVVDIASQPLRHIGEVCPDFPPEHLLENDYFKIEEKEFDLILEQTFFCALAPRLRPQYVKKMYELLKPGGILVGLLFDFPLSDSGPPFGGSAEEYHELFRDSFTIQKLERAHNSIPPRQGKELFFIFEK